LILVLDRCKVCCAVLWSGVILLSPFVEYLTDRHRIIYLPYMNTTSLLVCGLLIHAEGVYFEHFTRLGALHGCMHTFWEHYTTPGSKEVALAISRIEG
jgi:hypothetical protein